MIENSPATYYRQFHRKRCKTSYLGLDVVLFFLRNLIILLIACHLLNVASVVVEASLLKISPQSKITDWQIGLPEETIVEFVSNGKITFLDDILKHQEGLLYNSYRNFTSIMYLPRENTFFVMASQNVILKFEGENFHNPEILDVRQVECTSPELACHSRLLNVISYLDANGQSLLWFCFITSKKSMNKMLPADDFQVACHLRSVKYLKRNYVKWMIPDYTSTNINLPPLVLNSDNKFVFIGSFDKKGKPFIKKLSAPSYNTPFYSVPAISTSDIHFPAEGKVTFLTNFENGSAVYFVVRQELTETSGQHRIPIDRTEAYVIRICKHDSGLTTTINKKALLTTFKRVRLVCGHRGVYYDNIMAASWDKHSGRLFSTFSTQYGTPLGSAMCTFDIEDIDRASNGPLKESFNSTIAVFNKYKNLCSYFSPESPKLPDLKQIQLDSLRYRDAYYSVHPRLSSPIYQQVGIAWQHVIAHTMIPSHNDRMMVQVVYLASTNHIMKIVYVDQEPCLTETIRLNRVANNEVINQMDIKKGFLFLATSQRFVKIPLARCNLYESKRRCLRSHDPYCGWGPQIRQCVPLSDDDYANIELPQLDKCKVNRKKWSTWNDCEMIKRQSANYFGGSPVKCKCRHCLNHDECATKQQFTDCSEVDFKHWSVWSGWSNCSVKCGEGFMFRKRRCSRGIYCYGNDREYKTCTGRECQATYHSKSKWTPWLIEKRKDYRYVFKRFQLFCEDIRDSQSRTIKMKSATKLCASMNMDECSRAVETQIEREANWGLWSHWSSCSATCGGGQQTRYRSCDNPPPSRYSRFCSGESEERRLCSLQPCRSSVWGCWTEWSDCSAGSSCRKNSGWQWRKRECLMTKYLDDQLCKHVENVTVQRRSCTPDQDLCTTNVIGRATGRVSYHWSPCNEYGFKIKRKICSPTSVCSDQHLEYKMCIRANSTSDSDTKNRFTLLHIVMVGIASALVTGIAVGLVLIVYQCCKVSKNNSQNNLNRKNRNQNNLGSKHCNRNSNDVSQSSESSISYPLNIQEENDKLVQQQHNAAPAETAESFTFSQSAQFTNHQCRRSRGEVRPFSSLSMATSTRTRVSTPPSELNFCEKPPRPPRQKSPSSSISTNISLNDRYIIGDRPPRPPRQQHTSASQTSSFISGLGEIPRLPPLSSNNVYNFLRQDSAGSRDIVSSSSLVNNRRIVNT